MSGLGPKVVAGDQLLKGTTSRCPVCQAACPAEVWRVDGPPAKVFLRRWCTEHGEASICIASDARFYWLAKGKPENATRSLASAAATPYGVIRERGALGGSRDPGAPVEQFGHACCAATGRAAGTLGRNAKGRGDAPFEKLSTCLALIEIVNSCNLACPTCYADSPTGAAGHVDAVPLEELQRRIQGVIERKGRIEILQLSGGEPTLHPRFFELVEWAQSNPYIDYLLLNTNGVRIATEEAFAARLAGAARRGGLQLYLQFDGVQLEGQRRLRGADLRPVRRRAIERCRELKLPVTLAMTVTPENLDGLWQAIEFGLEFPHVRGICFQPLFRSGRLPLVPAEARLNTADIILAAVEQSKGRLRFEDFTPLPCGDPNCATIGYLLKANGRTYSVSDFIDFSRVQDFLRDKVRYKLEDLVKCGCESEPLGELLRRFEMDESNTFRLFVKPFMDAWTWDEDRIDRCCTHVIRPDGKLDSFCRYYSGFGDLKTAP
jgi:7,8-dihydro-6-hydroxymethylpterin dimethyltransferase